MNKDFLQNTWKQFRGQVKQRWGQLTDADLDMIAGHRDKLISKIQERYGYTRERAEREADKFITEIQGERVTR